MTAHATKLVTVEAFLIWTYQVQRADAMTAASAAASAQRCLGWPHASGDGIAAVARNAALGGSIAGGGISSALHPDAELAHAVIGGLGEATALLRFHGRTGGAPEWFRGARIISRPVVRANGKPVRIYDNRGHPVGVKMIEIIEWQGRTIAGSGATIEAARRSYGIWYLGLIELGRRLAGRLVAHRLIGPSAPAVPWEPPAAA